MLIVCWSGPKNPIISTYYIFGHPTLSVDQVMHNIGIFGLICNTLSRDYYGNR